MRKSMIVLASIATLAGVGVAYADPMAQNGYSNDFGPGASAPPMASNMDRDGYGGGGYANGPVANNGYGPNGTYNGMYEGRAAAVAPYDQRWGAESESYGNRTGALPGY